MLEEVIWMNLFCIEKYIRPQFQILSGFWVWPWDFGRIIIDGIDGIVTYFNLLLMTNNDNKRGKWVGNIGRLFVCIVMKLIQQILDDKNIYIIT